MSEAVPACPTELNLIGGQAGLPCPIGKYPEYQNEQNEVEGPFVVLINRLI